MLYVQSKANFILWDLKASETLVVKWEEINDEISVIVFWVTFSIKRSQPAGAAAFQVYISDILMYSSGFYHVEDNLFSNSYLKLWLIAKLHTKRINSNMIKKRF